AQTGRVDYPYLGIQFDIPDGWQGEQSGEYFMMGSHTDVGLLVMALNPAKSPEDLKVQADGGIVDEGTLLTRSGNFDQVGDAGLGAEFKGYFNGQKAKAYIIGMVSPFGDGVTIGAITSEAQYGPKMQQLARTLADSVAFAIPKESQKTKEWDSWFRGKRLTYMYSSYDSGSTYTDASGYVSSSYSGGSSTTKIELCPNNRFSYASSSEYSFDAEGGFGNSSSSGDGTGRWELVTVDEELTQLVLHYDDGNEGTYDLTYKDEKTQLNGSRYFVTEAKGCW
ncbi:MAG: hypothetical protein AAF497_25995, partial [Planctomycetota bacterium]